MDVNSINNSINTLNNSNISSNLDNKVGSSSAISKAQEEGLNLSVKEYNLQRDQLSLDVQGLNEGIAVTKITEGGLNKQLEYLQDIQKSLDNLRDDNKTMSNKNDIKNDINEKLRDFNQVAHETKYKHENLLNVEYYDEQTSHEISTQSNSFSIEKPHTPQFSSQIFEASNANDFNNISQLDNVTNIVESSINQVQNIRDKFTEFGNKLETSARETIQEQANLFNENRLKNDKNFGQESSDFSSANVNANSGYLVASQANIVQEQSVRLLS